MKRIYRLRPLSLISCVLHLISSVTSQNGDPASEIAPFSLRAGQQNHRRLKPKHPCVLVKVEVEYEESDDENEIDLTGRFVDAKQTEKKKGDEIRCELIGDDIEKADGHHFVPIVGIEEESLIGIESGVSTFTAEGAVILGGKLQIPQGASIEVGSIDDFIDGIDENGKMRWRRLQNQRQRRLRPLGVKRLLVVRADAYDGSTTADVAELSDDIFGTSGDKVTLKSQYRKCSHGKLTFEPYDGEGGVIEVELDRNVNGEKQFDIQDAMIDAAEKLVGNLADKADHVMLCLPKGTGDWIAYAYVGSWLSVYNDEWCQQLSTQVHEIGHNLGLSHSGKNGDDYSDKTGMMGYSFKDDDGPLQCFNPAKSYKLGWYEKSVVEWDPLEKGTWFGNIVGVTDYNNTAGTQTVILKIPRKVNGKHLYVGYNRKKNFNRGVVNEGNKVVIVEQANGYEVSNFLEGLKPKSTVSKKTFFNFENSNKNLVIDFMGFGDNKGINKASVALYFDDCIYPKCCNGEMCSEKPKVTLTSPATNPPTKAPTKIPTKTPTKAPIPIISREINRDPTPVLYEILANPIESKGQYFEIYNPHSTKINLKNYKICYRSGRNATQKCLQLTNFDLEPGEYYMLCRSKPSIPDSRTCHQELKIRIRKARKLIVSLVRAVNNRNESVDKIDMEPSVDHPGKAYIRKDSEVDDFCGESCWIWSPPPSS